uniref:Putative secreted peptide n=1 Tax=Anopheles braziliensis TaxID=58242 RepID=A0A2M3ZVB0_9DIPT
MTPTMISEIVRGLLMTSFFFLLGPTICVSSFFDCANSRNLRTCSRANCELNTRSYKAFTPAYSWITR